VDKYVKLVSLFHELEPGQFDVFLWLYHYDSYMSNLIYLVQWQGKNGCVCVMGHQLFAIGQVATGKKR